MRVLGDLIAVETRKHHVQNGQFGLLLLDRLECRGPIMGRDRLKTRRCQKLPHQAQNPRIVVNNQDAPGLTIGFEHPGGHRANDRRGLAW